MLLLSLLTLCFYWPSSLALRVVKKQKGNPTPKSSPIYLHAPFPLSLFFLIFTWTGLILINSKKQRFSELFHMKSLGGRCPCGSQDAQILPQGSEIPNMPWLNPFLLFKYGETPKQNFSSLGPLSFISQQIHNMQKILGIGLPKLVMLWKF